MMIESIDEKLKQAQSAKEKDDVLKHAERVRQAALNLMKENNLSETPEIKVNGHKVKFLDPNNLKLIVDGKVIMGKEKVDAEINRIDLVDSNMKKERNKERTKNIAKKEIKNIASVAKVSVVRNAVSFPMKMVESGQHTTGALLRALWSLLQKAMQR